MKQQRSAAQRTRSIPPPPGSDATDDEVIAYHKKYTLDELEQAGYAVPAPEEEEELAAAANYQWLCANGLPIKLTRTDYEQLSRLAAKKDVRVEKLAAKWIKERLRQEQNRTEEP